MEIFLLLVVILFVIMIYNKQSQVDLNINQLRKEIYTLKQAERDYSPPVEKVVKKPEVEEVIIPTPVMEQPLYPDVTSISTTQEDSIEEAPIVPVIIETPVQ